jgi:hypothetical protein
VVMLHLSQLEPGRPKRARYTIYQYPPVEPPSNTFAAAASTIRDLQPLPTSEPGPFALQLKHRLVADTPEPNRPDQDLDEPMLVLDRNPNSYLSELRPSSPQSHRSVPPSATQTCARCLIERPLAQFHSRTLSRMNATCVECINKSRHHLARSRHTLNAIQCSVQNESPSPLCDSRHPNSLVYHPDSIISCSSVSIDSFAVYSRI